MILCAPITLYNSNEMSKPYIPFLSEKKQTYDLRQNLCLSGVLSFTNCSTTLNINNLKSALSFKIVHLSNTKSLNLAGIRTVPDGLLFGSVVVAVSATEGGTTQSSGVLAPVELSGSCGVLYGLTNEMFLRCTVPSVDFKVSSCLSFV